MPMYNLYGAASDDLEEAKVALEEALGIVFTAREGLYNGEYYQFGDIGGEDFVLKFNVDPFDLEPLETKFPKYKVILYLSNTSRADEITEKIQAQQKFILLSQKEY